MALAKNIIRINGYKDGKRTHVDIEVPMNTFEFKNSLGQEFKAEAPCHLYDPAEAGFESGLEAVTSYNMWNWVSNKRITTRIW